MSYNPKQFLKFYSARFSRQTERLKLARILKNELDANSLILPRTKRECDNIWNYD